MSKKKNGYPKPRWLNFVPPRWISSDTKRLYAYLCIFGPDSCDHWNCRLAKKFYVSTRTIARRLRKLRELGLVWVENRQSPARVLHPFYYGDIQAWLLAAQRKKIGASLAKMGSTPRFPLGQKCPSESVRDKRQSLPSKERAKTTARDNLPRRKRRPPGKDSGSEGHVKIRRIDFRKGNAHRYREMKQQGLTSKEALAILDAEYDNLYG